MILWGDVNHHQNFFVGLFLSVHRELIDDGQRSKRVAVAVIAKLMAGRCEIRLPFLVTGPLTGILTKDTPGVEKEKTERAREKERESRRVSSIGLQLPYYPRRCSDVNTHGSCEDRHTIAQTYVIRRKHYRAR